MSVAAAAELLAPVLTGCGASDEDVAQAVRSAEEPLGEQLAEADQELERLRRELRASEREVRTADERAQAAAEQAIAPQRAALEQQTTAIRALEASLKQKEGALAAREKAVGVAEAQAAANTIDGDGTNVVGDDPQPGTYKSAGGDNCYRARLGAGGSDIIDNNLGAGPAVVTVRGSDFALEVSRCAPFRRTG